MRSLRILLVIVAVAAVPIIATAQSSNYTFTLIATDLDEKELPPGLTRDEVLMKLATPGQPPMHAKRATGMVGLFVNPWHE